MQVVILCGGMGTRIKEETEYRPKPMIEIGGKPILWHIMKTYSYYGFNSFILCLGFKGFMIKQYFFNYELLNNDFTIQLGSNKNVRIYNNHNESNWKVTLAETGTKAMTGARVKRIEKYVDTEIFMLTYGDGIADINIKELLDFHKSHGKIGTVSGVYPQARFGELTIDNSMVTSFDEKPQIKDGHINGGYFVFNREFFEYLDEDDECVLEKKPLEKLAVDRELMVYSHKGFWQCVDTYRDLMLLNKMLRENQTPPWKI